MGRASLKYPGNPAKNVCFDRELARLGPLVDDGLVLLGPEGIQITAKGRLLLRSIAMTFDRYLADDLNDGRFSKAI